MLKIVDYKLPKDVFGQKVNLQLLAQAYHVYEDRNHIGLRNTKTRSEVNRTTKKIYKQKGTGGARHGSRRANLYVGGGIIFGPRPLKRVLTLSSGLKEAARNAAFSARAKDKEVVVVSGISKLAKTKEVAEFLKKQSAKRFTFLLSEKAKDAVKFLRNLASANSLYYKDANAFDILSGGLLIIDEDVFASELIKTVKVAKASHVKEIKKRAVKKQIKTVTKRKENV